MVAVVAPRETDIPDLVLVPNPNTEPDPEGRPKHVIDWSTTIDQIEAWIADGSLSVVEAKGHKRYDPVRHPLAKIEEGFAIMTFHGEVDINTAASAWRMITKRQGEEACRDVETSVRNYGISTSAKPEEQIDINYAYQYMADQLGHLAALGVISYEQGQKILRSICVKPSYYDTDALYDAFFDAYTGLHFPQQQNT